MQLIDSIVGYGEELAAIRRDIHAHPEIGFEEARTAALVAEKLRSWGVDTVETGIGKTGVVGVINGKGTGRSIGLRADMDALPMDEETNLPYRSKNPGRFHGCGHDGHTTMLLGAARYLAATRNFAGTVNVIFQPAEEGLGGAAAMISDGLFDRFPCEEIYAIHNWPNAEIGWIGTRPGVAMAASGSFDIEITGRGAHAAMPQQSIDPTMVAVTLAQALQTIVSRNVEPLKTAIVSITKLHSGSAYNVIPHVATLGGTIRTFDEGTRKMITERIKELSAGVAAAFGASARVTVHPGYAALVNSQEHVDIVCRIASDVVGDSLVDGNIEPLTGSEDFSDMLAKVPGAYFMLGQSPGPNLHNPKYDFNDAIIPLGATLFARLAETRAVSA